MKSTGFSTRKTDKTNNNNASATNIWFTYIASITNNCMGKITTSSHRDTVWVFLPNPNSLSSSLLWTRNEPFIRILLLNFRHTIKVIKFTKKQLMYQDHALVWSNSLPFFLELASNKSQLKPSPIIQQGASN